MNQLSMAQFIRIKPLDSSKSVLLNVKHIVAVEEIIEHHILRIQTTTQTYETGGRSLEDLEQVLSRTSTISRF